MFKCCLVITDFSAPSEGKFIGSGRAREREIEAERGGERGREGEGDVDRARDLISLTKRFLVFLTLLYDLYYLVIYIVLTVLLWQY